MAEETAFLFGETRNDVVEIKGHRRTYAAHLDKGVEFAVCGRSHLQKSFVVESMVGQ